MVIKKTKGDRVTETDKEEILAVYLREKSIARTSKITGWSIPTVNKYVKNKSIWEPTSRDFPGYIIQKDIEGKIVNKFKTAQEAEMNTGIPRSSISQAIHGRIKTAGGFKWERVYKHKKNR